MITEADLERKLEQLGREYRAIRYRGPALRNLPAAPPRRVPGAGAGAWAWTGAIGGVFAAVLWLWWPEPQFGADARLAPSPYAALKQVRQSLPVSPATLPQRQALPLSISPPALPPLPPRRSGFAQTAPSQALHRPLPARFGQA